MPPARRTAVRPRRLGAASVPSAVGELAITLVPVKAAYATPPRRPTATRIAGVHGRVLQPGQPTPGQRRGRARDLRASTRPGTRDPARPPSGPQAAVLSALRRPRAPAAPSWRPWPGPPRDQSSRVPVVRVVGAEENAMGGSEPPTPPAGRDARRAAAARGRRARRRSYEVEAAGAQPSHGAEAAARDRVRQEPDTRYGHEACEVFRAGHTTRGELMWNVTVLAAVPVATAADGGDAGPGRRKRPVGPSMLTATRSPTSRSRWSPGAGLGRRRAAERSRRSAAVRSGNSLN
jgi:hypothetical protein